MSHRKITIWCLHPTDPLTHFLYLLFGPIPLVKHLGRWNLGEIDFCSKKNKIFPTKTQNWFSKILLNYLCSWRQKTLVYLISRSTSKEKNDVKFKIGIFRCKIRVQQASKPSPQEPFSGYFYFWENFRTINRKLIEINY